jgi:hypothetical protein
VRFIALFFIISLCSCTTWQGSFEGDAIRLSSLKNDTLDFSSFGKEVALYGVYRGTLVMENTQFRTIRFKKAKFLSPEMGVSLVVDGYCDNTKILGDKWKAKGGVVFSGPSQHLEISGLHSKGALWGINLASPYKHRNVAIMDSYFKKSLTQGIRVGSIYENAPFAEGVYVKDNVFKKTGHDGVQFRKCSLCEISGNTFKKTGTKRLRGIEYAISVSDNSSVYLSNNKFKNAAPRFFSLNSAILIRD